MLSSIYLTGGNLDALNGVSQFTSPDWRSLATTKLHRYGLKVVNPLELFWTDIDGNDPNQTNPVIDLQVRRSLDLIDQCDALLANLSKSSYGTAMEIFYAYRRGKIVTVVGQSPFSPWVLSHSQARFEDIDRALDYIIDEQPHSAPFNWALQYEAQLSERYEQLPPPGEPDYKFIGGELPVLVLAPHATAYWREGEFQEADTFTGSMAAVLNRTAGCHSLLTFYCCVADPCWHLETPLRRALADIVKAGQIGLVVILLGTSWHETATLQLSAYGPKEQEREEYLTRLKLKLGHLEPISTETSDHYASPLAKFAAEDLAVPTVIVKMHKRYRMPRLQLESFSKMVTALSEFISETGHELNRSPS
jgi:hypothetical protein